VRARCDAILIGARTVRRDNPRLVVRAPARVRERLTRGESPSPIKVTVTGSGNLDPQSAFFTTGEAEKLVYCTTTALPAAQRLLDTAATTVDAGELVSMSAVVADLHARGVRRLMVEGGQEVHTQFLSGDLADELQLVVAPFFVGDSAARRFVGDARFPWNSHRRAELADVRHIGDVVLLRYALSGRFCLDQVGAA
jgi:5-amino-6-(5-phosphoribosylamino)uracil reductase